MTLDWLLAPRPVRWGGCGDGTGLARVFPPHVHVGGCFCAAQTETGPNHVYIPPPLRLLEQGGRLPQNANHKWWLPPTRLLQADELLPPSQGEE